MSAKTVSSSSIYGPIKRKAVFDFLSVKGCEKVKSYRKPYQKEFTAPEKIGTARFQVEKRKRGRLGVRRWKMKYVKGNIKIPAKLPSPPKIDFEVSNENIPPTQHDAPTQAKEEAAKQVTPDWERLIIWEPTEEDLKVDENLTTIEVEGILCKWLRPHQREGVLFTTQCVLGEKDFEGNGVILADDMGLGKTLQAITALYTLMRQGKEKGVPTVKRAIVVCPTSLVGNWENELQKWLKGRLPCVAVKESGPAKIESAIWRFLSNTNRNNILIISYDTFRRYAESFYDKAGNKNEKCGLLICDEAHRLKNHKTATYEALNKLSCKKRILLSGTPMQNDLDEFFAMVNFTNPNVLGDRIAFRKYYEIPILAGREPDCANSEEKLGVERSSELSAIVNQFILRRTNTLLSKHLPPKVIQVVCCRPTNLQRGIYNVLVKSRDARRIISEGQKSMSRILPLINNIKGLCNHPKIIWNMLKTKKKKLKKWESDCLDQFPSDFERESGHPRFSGKLDVLDRLLRKVKSKTDDRVVLVSNYTSTLNVFEDMARIRKWGFIRLDGSIQVKDRSKLVAQLDDRKNDKFLFLLSSKAGGCGLNLVGANRLVLYDPDWNPAVDKQAAARVWRDGQTKRCFVYRFLTSGTIEEKVYQRQLSKEGLQNVLGGAATDALVSMANLRRLFELSESPSDTHETLDCQCLQKIKRNEGKDEGEDILHHPVDKCLLGQRGHPKEEDLINWGHHGSTSSLPDPLFREAFQSVGKEENYVSFAFSCEVRGREMPMEDTQQADAVSAMCDDPPVVSSTAEKKGIEISAQDAQERRNKFYQERLKKKKRTRDGGYDDSSADDDDDDEEASSSKFVRRSTRARKKTQRLGGYDDDDDDDDEGEENDDYDDDFMSGYDPDTQAAIYAAQYGEEEGGERPVRSSLQAVRGPELGGRAASVKGPRAATRKGVIVLDSDDDGDDGGQGDEMDEDEIDEDVNEADSADGAYDDDDEDEEEEEEDEGDEDGESKGDDNENSDDQSLGGSSKGSADDFE